MAIRILTDSTSDIPRSQADQWGLEIAPLKVRFGSEEYIDGVTLMPQEFYEKLTSSDVLPQTSQVNPEEFCRLFQQYREQGDEVVGLFISSDLSGTYQSAGAARHICGEEGIYLTDSRTVTFGLGLLVREALRLREAGATAQQIHQQVEEMKEKLRFYAAVDTLKYLRMGGRLSGTAAVVGSLLNIKPLIAVQNGKVEAVHKTRGLAAALDWMVGQMEKDGVEPGSLVMFGHTNAPELCQQFIEKARQRVTIDRWDSTAIGSVVGTHAGPGCTGLAYLKP